MGAASCIGRLLGAGEEAAANRAVAYLGVIACIFVLVVGLWKLEIYLELKVTNTNLLRGKYMIQNKKKLYKMKWYARIIAIIIIIFALPFYLGYGNPLPFINPEYTLWDNMWLTIFPIIFIGLTVGLKFHKMGGYLVTISIIFGLVMGLLIERELVVYMLVPLGEGIFYLIIGYKDKKN